MRTVLLAHAQRYPTARLLPAVRAVVERAGGRGHGLDADRA